MPKIHTITAERETIDLHADWWSSEKTEDGRWKERCTVYRHYLEKDERWVNEQLFAGFKMPTNRRAKTPDFDQSGLARTRIYFFQAMIVEMTDETGHLLPMQRRPGMRPMLAEEIIAGLSIEDADFIDSEIRGLQIPVVVVDAADEDEAARNAAREHPNLSKHDPEVVARDNFRRPLEIALPE